MRTPGHVLLLAIFLSASSLTAADIFSSPTEKDVPALVLSLRDSNVQLGASRALASLKSKAVPALVKALGSESSEVRIWAAYTLGQIGHHAAAAVPRLAETISKGTDPHERSAAARSLGQIATAKTAAKPVAVRALVHGLSDSNGRVRARSAASLGQLGPEAREATSALIKLFSDEPSRQAAQKAVIQIGQAAATELVASLDDDTLRLEAAHVLRNIDPAAARKAGVDHPSKKDLPALLIAVRNETRDTRSRVEAAVQIGEVGIEGAPILIAEFSNGDEQVARAAAAAFQKIGSAGVPLLTETLKGESATVRAKAADALGAIGPKAKAAVPNLTALFADSDRTVQHRAVVALGAFGEAASDAVPALIEVMQNPRILEPTRQLALKVLVREATASQRELVIAALEKSSKDGNFGISSLAGYSLKKLKADAKEPSP
jgi:HEAT repeat protein